jgi:hypothetical protein
MPLVVLLSSPDLDGFTEGDMRRWWRNHCKKHTVNGETFFEVSPPIRYNTREGVRRLASFGVASRVARRAIKKHEGG